MGRKKNTHHREVVRRMFDTHSYTEIAARLGTSGAAVCRIVKELGLSRNKTETTSIRRKRQLRLVESERLRYMCMLPQRTKKKVVEHPLRNLCRRGLKRHGYVIEPGALEVWVPCSIRRHRKYENRGMILGFKFNYEN